MCESPLAGRWNYLYLLFIAPGTMDYYIPTYLPLGTYSGRPTPRQCRVVVLQSAQASNQCCPGNDHQTRIHGICTRNNCRAVATALAWIISLQNISGSADMRTTDLFWRRGAGQKEFFFLAGVIFAYLEVQVP